MNQWCANLVDLEDYFSSFRDFLYPRSKNKCCKMSIYFSKSTSIQPRASRLKFADTYLSKCVPIQSRTVTRCEGYEAVAPSNLQHCISKKPHAFPARRSKVSQVFEKPKECAPPFPSPRYSPSSPPRNLPWDWRSASRKSWKM